MPEEARRSVERILAMREQRGKQQALAATVDAAGPASQAAKNLAEAASMSGAAPLPLPMAG